MSILKKSTDPARIKSVKTTMVIRLDCELLNPTVDAMIVLVMKAHKRAPPLRRPVTMASPIGKASSHPRSYEMGTRGVRKKPKREMIRVVMSFALVELSQRQSTLSRRVDPTVVVLNASEKLKVRLMKRLKAMAPKMPASMRKIALVAISMSEYPYGLMMKLQFEAKATKVP